MRIQIDLASLLEVRIMALGEILILCAVSGNLACALGVLARLKALTR